ncbi:MAG: Holliday junction branch migration protein RuvA [Rickettsiales bacterium]|nr:MAG: Holliday junction branch migration protein RuvA [Rickettsiales bacterium]
MIGKLKGKIDSIDDGYFIIDVGGVGYMVYCSGKTMSKLVPDEYAEILVETHVREDHIHLYGFYDMDEKSMFNILQSVKGVGTRMALGILSHLAPVEIQLALSAQDKTMFLSVSGVGKKLADRIITELKDKFPSTGVISPAAMAASAARGGASQAHSSVGMANDAISALANLGISKIDAQNRVQTIIASNPDISINELIRLALKTGASSTI